MIQTWEITASTNEEVYFSENSSLDAVTRQLPDGYYSTFRTFDGCMRVLGLKAHLRRLPDINAASLRRQLILLLEPYRPGEARVRVMLTYEGRVYISIEPLKPLPREIYEKGVHVKTTEIRRDSPRIKSTAFISASDVERKYIAETGVFESLLMKAGKILEGMTSNFFYVRDGVLYTAQRNILLGVTRRTVIRLARRQGVIVNYDMLPLNQLSAVSEAFITSSTRGIVPVVQVDDVLIDDGRPGRITQVLMSAYEENISRRLEKL